MYQSIWDSGFYCQNPGNDEQSSINEKLEMMKYKGNWSPLQSLDCLNFKFNIEEAISCAKHQQYDKRIPKYRSNKFQSLEECSIFKHT